MSETPVVSAAEHQAFSPTCAGGVPWYVLRRTVCLLRSHVRCACVRAGEATVRQCATILAHSSCAYKGSAAKAELQRRVEAGDREAAAYLAWVG